MNKTTNVPSSSHRCSSVPGHPLCREVLLVVILVGLWFPEQQIARWATMNWRVHSTDYRSGPFILRSPSTQIPTDDISERAPLKLCGILTFMNSCSKYATISPYTGYLVGYQYKDAENAKTVWLQFHIYECNVLCCLVLECVLVHFSFLLKLEFGQN